MNDRKIDENQKIMNKYFVYFVVVYRIMPMNIYAFFYLFVLLYK